MSKNKYEVLHEGEKCPKCHQPMQRREHKNISAKQRKAPYYFREWDYCTSCNHLQHYEHFKVMNSSGGSEECKHYQAFQKHQESFLDLLAKD